ncbi:MAG TPA: hypothetical protein VJB14_03055 [Planctomycetota bacterium]|nr:hypothetical protein [Planctomycetota bacterium]
MGPASADGRLAARLLDFEFDRLTPEEWVIKGGADEDSPVWRVLNHFYDPLHQVGLDILGSGDAPTWALEDRGDLAPQRYSYRDTRDAFYKGLTASSATTRERELGHTFYALGHVIHMIQDMAQPQHTRDDAHFFLGPTASLLELYLDDNMARFDLNSAPIPQVTLPRDLWSTGESGRGLADFSNRHFVSAGTNFTELRDGGTAERFPSPALNVADFNSEADTCRDGTPAPGGDRAGLVFYANSFPDPVSGATLRNARMTTFSIFDQHLQARGFKLLFALNCFNIDAAAALLLPRAVSYSAALLRYFFRGRLEATADASGLRIVNRTPGEDMRGAFKLYYDTPDGTRRLLASWTLVVPSGQSSGPLTVAPPPQDAAPGAPCLLVFRGALGQEPEDAVAGQTVSCPAAPVDDPPPPPPPPPLPPNEGFCCQIFCDIQFFTGHYSTQADCTGPECFFFPGLLDQTGYFACLYRYLDLRCASGG